MAKIWFVREGGSPRTSEKPQYELPFNQCKTRLSLSRNRFSPNHPQFEDPTGLAPYAGFRHVTVEMDNDEEASIDWPIGFYISPLRPREVIDKLGPPNVLVPKHEA